MSTEQQFERFYVLEQFRQFYAEVLRFKQEIEAGTAPETEVSLDDMLASDPSEGAEPLDPAALQALRAEQIHGDLIALMQRQTQDILRRGDEREQRRFREVQYVMAAMADEVLLNLEWAGRDYWSGNLLEEELFHSHDAGTRFFANLEELLRKRDPTRAEVAAAYLLALSLGFRGKYRDVESQPKLEHYRQQLFATLFQRNPGLSDDAQLYSQAYAHTLAGKQVQWLPLLRPWLFAVGGVVLAYIFVGHLVWALGTREITGRVERLTTPERAAGEAAPQARALPLQEPDVSPAAGAKQASSAVAAKEPPAPASERAMLAPEAAAAPEPSPRRPGHRGTRSKQQRLGRAHGKSLSR